jgi:serine/threonine-protein phosphatase 5
MGSPQEEATELKNQGNEAFKNQNYQAALDLYSKAIETYDKDPSFFTNRAQVRTHVVTQKQSLTPLLGTSQA